jgi:hypothetical protein
MWKSHWLIGDRILGNDMRGLPVSRTFSVKQERYATLFYLAKVLWIGLASVLSFWIASISLRMLA